MTSSYSLVATLPAEFEETYRTDLVVSAIVWNTTTTTTNDSREESSGWSTTGWKVNHIPVIACDTIRLSPTSHPLISTSTPSTTSSTTILENSSNSASSSTTGSTSTRTGANVARLVAVFCPSALVASACAQTPQHRTNSCDYNNYRYDATATEPPLPSQHARPVVEWYNDDDDETTKLSHILLSLIHPFLAQNFTIRAILTHPKQLNCIADDHDPNPRRLHPQNAPGDIVLINLSHCPYDTIVDELLEATNCEVIRSGSEAILKILLLSALEFGVSPTLPQHQSSQQLAAPPSSLSLDHRKWHAPPIEIPTCAVCLFRIDPARLGLPRPPNHQLCSKFCSPTRSSVSVSSSVSSFADQNRFHVSCPRQRLLLPWLPPNHCETCHTIRNYWMKYSDDTTTTTYYNNNNERDEVFCNLCGLQETLWVCLTCAFVGCGRYSNKHAAEHNDTTYHPFCLELSTLRIWSYVDSEFVHRMDLLECPASLQNLHQQLPSLVVYGGSTSSTQRSFSSTIPFSNRSTTQGMVSQDTETNQDFTRNTGSRYRTFVSDSPNVDVPPRLETDHYDRVVASTFASVDEKTPKKATMIGEEYEVLLQSALEDQAQYFEGEIAWLRATLSAEQVNRTTVTPDEASEIQSLGVQNNQLRMDIERAGRELLDAQGLEAGYRAASQRLLHEQSNAQTLLKKITEESKQERDQGRLLIEDLELQISDLKANQRMMEQFSQNDDLKNSQILGAERHLSDSAQPTTGSRGRKSKKFSKPSRNST